MSIFSKIRGALDDASDFVADHPLWCAVGAVVFALFVFFVAGMSYTSEQSEDKKKQYLDILRTADEATIGADFRDYRDAQEIIVAFGRVRREDIDVDALNLALMEAKKTIGFADEAKWEKVQVKE